MVVRLHPCSFDHLNKFTVQALNSKARRFIVPLAVEALIEKWGVPREKIVELDWWEEFRFDRQLMVAAS